MSNNNFDFRNFSLKNFYKDGYTPDCTCMVSETDKISLRNILSIDKQEDILFMRDTSFWNNRNQGCVITDQGFYIIQDNNKLDEFIYLPWVSIKEVKADSGNLIFCMSYNEDYPISEEYFFKYNAIDNGLNKMARYFTRIAESIEEEDIFQLIENNQYDEAIEAADRQIVQNDNPYPHWCKGYALLANWEDEMRPLQNSRAFFRQIICICRRFFVPLQYETTTQYKHKFRRYAGESAQGQRGIFQPDKHDNRLASHPRHH